MKTIYFQDNGQDFTHWQIDDKGMVVDSQPFQAHIWTGCKVLNHAIIQPGDEVYLQLKDGHEMTLRHLIEGVTPINSAPKRTTTRCPYQPRADLTGMEAY